VSSERRAEERVAGSGSPYSARDRFFYPSPRTKDQGPRTKDQGPRTKRPRAYPNSSSIPCITDAACESRLRWAAAIPSTSIFFASSTRLAFTRVCADMK